MAYLSIREYEHVAAVSNGTVPVGVEPALVSQRITIAGTSAQSAVLNARTRFVRLSAGALCSVEFEASPTAVAGYGQMASGQTEYFGVDPTRLGALKVAVISG